MDWVARAIERGERTPEEIACLRASIRSVRRELGLPARGPTGSPPPAR